MFDELRRVGIELFADEPDVAERIELLYSEILTDEIGHVGYCASRCTTAERAVMRCLYPRIGRLFARQTAEISLLIDLEKLRARLDRPFDVEELTAGLTTRPTWSRTREAASAVNKTIRRPVLGRRLSAWTARMWSSPLAK